MSNPKFKQGDVIQDLADGTKRVVLAVITDRNGLLCYRLYEKLDLEQIKLYGQKTEVLYSHILIDLTHELLNE